jgi:hypothetical protein
MRRLTTAAFATPFLYIIAQRQATTIGPQRNDNRAHDDLALPQGKGMIGILNFANMRRSLSSRPNAVETERRSFWQKTRNETLLILFSSLLKAQSLKLLTIDQ